jgi:hypothetical protein
VDLYGAVVTTTPFLLVALLVEARAFGPAPGRTRRAERRHDRRTDLQVLVFLAIGFGSALVGLMLEIDHWSLRSVAGAGLAVGASMIFVILWRDINDLYVRHTDDS